VTAGADCRRPFAVVAGADEGAVSADGRVMGTYLHGLFAADGFRRAFLAALGAKPDPAQDYEAGIEQSLDGLARHLETHLDLDALLALSR
jgi:adenosylcobyric acid synthase